MILFTEYSCTYHLSLRSMILEACIKRKLYIVSISIEFYDTSGYE